MKRKPHPTTTARREAERRTMVRRVRAKVRDGTYENALKLSVALDRLIEQLRG
jgi:hypothetical protein